MLISYSAGSSKFATLTTYPYNHSPFRLAYPSTTANAVIGRNSLLMETALSVKDTAPAAYVRSYTRHVHPMGLLNYISSILLGGKWQRQEGRRSLINQDHSITGW